jgi:hypothetical protein
VTTTVLIFLGPHVVGRPVMVVDTVTAGGVMVVFCRREQSAWRDSIGSLPARVPVTARAQLLSLQARTAGTAARRAMVSCIVIVLGVWNEGLSNECTVVILRRVDEENNQPKKLNDGKVLDEG